jgi:hypothetical protein
MDPPDQYPPAVKLSAPLQDPDTSTSVPPTSPKQNPPLQLIFTMPGSMYPLPGQESVLANATEDATLEAKIHKVKRVLNFMT